MGETRIGDYHTDRKPHTRTNYLKSVIHQIPVAVNG